MRTPSKIIAGLSLAGLAVAGGSAFTAAGLSSAVDADTQFIGGTVSEDITGAVLDEIEYTYNSATDSKVQSVALDFAASVAGRTVTIQFDGGTTFACTVAADPADDTATCNTSASGGVDVVDDISVKVV